MTLYKAGGGNEYSSPRLMGTLINGNSGLWGHISWDKSSCMLISSDKRDSTSDKGDIFIFNIYFCIVFSSLKLTLLQ